MNEKIIALTNHYNEQILNFDYSKLQDDDLLKGKLGIVNYLLSFYDHTKKEVYLEKISEIMEMVFSNIEENTENNILNDSTLLYGASGLGFTLKQLIDRNLIDINEFEEQLQDIDEIILNHTIKLISEEYFDFLGGPLGNLQYFIDKKKANPEEVNIIIDHLEKSVQQTGMLFYTKSDSIYTKGYNMGLKHGHLGIIKTLINYVEVYGKNERVIGLIEKIFQHMTGYLDFDYKIEDIHIYKNYAVFEESNKTVKHQNNRLCWCNSDLTLAYYLAKSGKIVNNRSYVELSKKIGTETTKRQSFKTTGIESHYFCHGSSGLAFLYDALYEIDSDPLYDKAAQYWHLITFEYLKNEMDLGISIEDLPWLRGGKLGSLLVLNKMYDNTLFSFLT